MADALSVTRLACEICGGETRPYGQAYGKWRGRNFSLRRCGGCRFIFVEDPDTDFENIYDLAYYQGRGADDLIDYCDEWLHPDETLRQYEWRGLTSIARRLQAGREPIAWLDYGCGVGSFVRYLRERESIEAWGYEQSRVHEAGRIDLPYLLEGAELRGVENRFDVVTAIEVLEHLIDPLATLREIQRILKPGGYFIYTTGNAAPFEARLQEWAYVVPEIHVSLFQPRTIELALRRTGFGIVRPLPSAAFRDVIRYKVLKSLRRRRATRLFDLLPWSAISTVVDRRYQISAMPFGVKVGAEHDRL